MMFEAEDQQKELLDTYFKSKGMCMYSITMNWPQTRYLIQGSLELKGQTLQSAMGHLTLWLNTIPLTLEVTSANFFVFGKYSEPTTVDLKIWTKDRNFDVLTSRQR